MLISLVEATMMFNKVLILSAAVGAGHVRAAQAIERAFIETNAALGINGSAVYPAAA